MDGRFSDGTVRTRGNARFTVRWRAAPPRLPATADTSMPRAPYATFCCSVGGFIAAGCSRYRLVIQTVVDRPGVRWTTAYALLFNYYGGLVVPSDLVRTFEHAT
jgi:hypothetical protein